jgi:hypothetical protein
MFSGRIDPGNLWKQMNDGHERRTLKCGIKKAASYSDNSSEIRKQLNTFDNSHLSYLPD